MEWISQAREWKELYADDVGAYFYQKKTTREWQWEAPTSQGYIRTDTRLVLQDGTVIDDPGTPTALKASPTSKVSSDQLSTASPMNDASTMLAQMQAWKDEEDHLELNAPYLEIIPLSTGGLNISDELIREKHPHEAAAAAATTTTTTTTVQPLSSGLREKFLKRREKSAKTDIDDVVDLKPSVKPTAKMPTTATNSVLVALFTDSSPPTNANDASASATSPNVEGSEYRL